MIFAKNLPWGPGPARCCRTPLAISQSQCRFSEETLFFRKIRVELEGSRFSEDQFDLSRLNPIFNKIIWVEPAHPDFTQTNLSHG